MEDGLSQILLKKNFPAFRRLASCVLTFRKKARTDTWLVL